MNSIFSSLSHLFSVVLVVWMAQLMDKAHAAMQGNIKGSLNQLSKIAADTMKRTDYESLAVQMIPAVKQRDVQSSLMTKHSHSKKKYRYLCSTFIKWSSSNLDRLVFNMLKSHNFCSWLVIVYDIDVNHDFYSVMMNQNTTTTSSREGKDITVITHLMKQFLKQQYYQLYHGERHSNDGNVGMLSSSKPPFRMADMMLVSKHNKTRVFHDIFTSRCDHHVETYILPYYNQMNIDKRHNPCGFLHNSSFDEHSFHNPHVLSKGSLFTVLLPYLPNYDYVWVLDDDMSFENLNLTAFELIHGCSFEQPPIITQPLVDIKKQPYTYLMKKYWDDKCNTLASTVGFIEIQAPLFQARFLEWYILGFIIPLLPAMHVLGGDWGLDELFCAAAHEYLRTPPLIHGMNGITPACAVIIANMSLHHADGGDVRKSMRSDLRADLNTAFMNFARKYFSSFSFEGLQYHVNPLKRGTNFYMINKLRDDCSV